MGGPSASPPRAGGPEYPIFAVPYLRNRSFTGREDTLKTLRESLIKRRKSALTQAIKGLGGIGKTQTAVEYAYRYKDKYNAILWVRASSEVEIRNSFVEAAKLLGFRHDEANPGVTVRWLKKWLEQEPDYLLVVDNADTPNIFRAFMPRTTKGHVIVTSRSSNLDVLQIDNQIDLESFPPDEAVAFLLKRTMRENSHSVELRAARNLAEELGYLPLALEQAAAYIREVGASFVQYLELYRRLRVPHLEKTKLDPADYPASVATTWEANFQEVAKESPASRDVLWFSAFLAADSIPFELFTGGSSAITCTLRDQLASDYDRLSRFRELLAQLSQFSLIVTSHESSTFSVHRMVQEVIKHNLGDDCRAWTNRAVELTNAAFPSGKFETWNECGRLCSHAIAVVDRLRELDMHPAAGGDLASRVGIFLHGQAQYADAEPRFLQALEIARTALGEQHPDYAVRLNYLAELLRSTGRHEEAELLYRQALEISRAVLGEEHPAHAAIVNNLAELLRSTGRYEEAEPLYRQVLEITRMSLGDKHTDYATSLNNLALLLQDTGRYTEAEPLYRQSLEVTRKAVGEEHPDFAKSLDNLAWLLQSTERCEEAEPLYRQSLEVTLKAVGEEHPDFARSLNSLAGMLNSTGRPEDAEPLYRQALEIARTALGEEHPSLAAILEGLAELLRSRGCYEEAEPLCRQAIEITRTAFGEEHPEFARSLNNLAGMFFFAGRYAEAEPLFERARDIILKAVGEGHPNYHSTLDNLAALYDRTDREEDAAALRDQVAALRAKQSGS